MAFDGKSGKLNCESCGREIPVEEYERQYGSDSGQAEAEADEDEEAPLGEDTYIRSGSREEEQTVQMQMYHCPSCGAELMTDEHTAAVICSFCGNPGLIADRMSGVIKPKASVSDHEGTGGGAVFEMDAARSSDA